jgi:hypothetical protein
MTHVERRGLLEVMAVARQYLLGRGRRHSQKSFDDMLAAVRWIDRQLGIDQRRRKPRGSYR